LYQARRVVQGQIISVQAFIANLFAYLDFEVFEREVG
jgi:hypothetical protein